MSGSDPSRAGSDALPARLKTMGNGVPWKAPTGAVDVWLRAAWACRRSARHKPAERAVRARAACLPETICVSNAHDGARGRGRGRGQKPSSQSAVHALDNRRGHTSVRRLPTPDGCDEWSLAVRCSRCCSSSARPALRSLEIALRDALYRSPGRRVREGGMWACPRPRPAH